MKFRNNYTDSPRNLAIQMLNSLNHREDLTEFDKGILYTITTFNDQCDIGLEAWLLKYGDYRKITREAKRKAWGGQKI